jgi:hypothetical protein
MGSNIGRPSVSWRLSFSSAPPWIQDFPLVEEMPEIDFLCERSQYVNTGSKVF